MLVPLHRVVRAARRGGYAVGAFNTSNLEVTQAILAAATRLRSPVIINVTEKAIAYAGLEPIAVLVRTLASRVRIPVVLNLDHGHDPTLARRALTQGFTGIMLDASRETYQTNVRWTRGLVRAAKRYNAGVEGELGVVAYRGEEVSMTDPEEAAAFVRSTGVDAFAVGIGNRHGTHQAGERLNLHLLAKIRQRVSVPLVLHGASDTAPATIRKAIKLGITKINIDTALRLAFTRTLRTTLKRNPALYDPREVLLPSRASIERVVAQKIRLFGSARRG